MKKKNIPTQSIHHFFFFLTAFSELFSNQQNNPQKHTTTQTSICTAETLFFFPVSPLLEILKILNILKWFLHCYFGRTSTTAVTLTPSRQGNDEIGTDTSRQHSQSTHTPICNTVLKILITSITRKVAALFSQEALISFLSALRQGPEGTNRA